ncbi:adenylyltransferase/cytidyltransferase family protein [Patescibacteria group bacterium]
MVNRKIITVSDLKSCLPRLRQTSTLVLATGCFDVLHQAHIDFLKAAKNKGDLLIVGLEKDQRVTALKGKNRPINNWQKRVDSLAKLKMVDFVFSLPNTFSNSKDHLKLLKLIKPDIFAVSQNTPNLEKKQKLVEKIKAKLFIFPFNQKYSTTSLLTKQVDSD